MADERAYKGQWSFIPRQTEDAGLILQDVRHWQHLLATDMRVTSLWVGKMLSSDPFLVNHVRKLALGSSHLPLKDSTRHKSIEQLILIAPFLAPASIGARYESTGPVLGNATDTEPLVVEQEYLFTDYGKDPPHEPGAVVNAARIYPLLTFRYPRTAPGATAFNYIRVDYRLAISLEEFFASVLPARNAAVPAQRSAVGLFSDAKTAFPPTVSGLFDRIEKPVPYEILSEGLDWGEQSYWDNIHQWPAGEELPATPGAAHAAHTHWRWGAAAASRLNPLIALGAGKAFEGFRGPGSPLIDPRIPIQRLRFAITEFLSDKVDPRAWAPAANGSTRQFEQLFYLNRKKPAELRPYRGTPLVTWISLEACRPLVLAGESWEGTFFPKGIFFTHDHVPLKLKVAARLGALNAAAQKGSTQDRVWQRPDPRTTQRRP